mmetsp:Transcript_21305/g.32976  ORF Transcript_21305/g.32976 Transcript_21305/m.32976 type:complete len:145 (-) Transcript_21305:68-502(-)
MREKLIGEIKYKCHPKEEYEVRNFFVENKIENNMVFFTLFQCGSDSFFQTYQNKLRRQLFKIDQKLQQSAEAKASEYKRLKTERLLEEKKDRQQFLESIKKAARASTMPMESRNHSRGPTALNSANRQSSSRGSRPIDQRSSRS